MFFIQNTILSSQYLFPRSTGNKVNHGFYAETDFNCTKFDRIRIIRRLLTYHVNESSVIKTWKTPQTQLSWSVHPCVYLEPDFCLSWSRFIRKPPSSKTLSRIHVNISVVIKTLKKPCLNFF